MASGTVTANGTVTVGDGSNAVSVTGATNNPTITSTGNFTVAASGTFTSTSGTLSVAGNFSNSGTFTHNSGTVSLTGTTQTVSGTTTFNNLTIDKTNSPTISFTSGTTQTISGSFTATGDATHQITIGATTTSAATLSKASGTVTCSYCTISYSTATGGATWNAFVGSGNINSGNNTGWVFSPTASYWVAGTGNWSDATNHWATSSNGSPGAANLPGTTSNVFFDANSGTGTVTIDSASVTVSNVTESSANITVATSTNGITISGSLEVDGTISGATAVTMSGTNKTTTGTGTISAPFTMGANHTISVDTGNTLTVSGVVGGAYTLSKVGAGTFVLSGANTFSNGLTIKAGTVSLTTSTSAGGGSGTGTITLGDTSGSIAATLQGDGRTFANPIALATGTTGTLTVQPSATACIFSGGVTGTNNLTLNGSSTYTLELSTATVNNVGTITNVNTGTGTVTISSVIGTNVTGLTQNSSTSALTLSGINTYTGPITNSAGTLNLTQDTTYSTMTLAGDTTTTFTNGKTFTLTSFVSTATLGHLATVNTPSAGNFATLSDTTGTNAVSYVSIKDSHATGGATWNAYTSNGNVDATGNTGWVFTTNTAPTIGTGPSDGSSSSTTPTNAGQKVTFTATATDGESDNYYLAICKTNSITAVNNGAPTCATSQTWAVSASTASGAQASVTYTTSSLSSESNAWFAFVCDYNASSACSSASQGTGDSGSPFAVNRAPSFTATSAAVSSIAVGALQTFNTTSSDSDTDGSADTVTLYACKSNDFTGSACGTAGEWCHSSSGSASNASCTYTIQATDGYGSKNYFGYIIDNHSFASTSNPLSATFTIYATSPGTPAPPASWLSGWTYRKKITISNTNVDANLTDFPLLVKIAEAGGGSTNIGANCLSSGYDIRFTSSDGATLLKYERETFSVASSNLTANIWVKVPTVSQSASTDIYIYYGKTGATDGEDAANVWDVNFKGVWHSKDSTDTSHIADSTGVNNGTKKAAGEPLETTGKIGNAQDYDGTDDYVNAGSNSSLNITADITISAWINMVSFGQSSYGRIVSNRGGLGSGGYELAVDNSAIVKGLALIADSTVYESNASIVDTGGWYNVAVTRSGTGLTFYVNGVSAGTQTVATINSSSSSLLIGQRGDSLRYFDGDIDDVKISNSARAAEWIKFEYHNQGDSGNNLTFASQEGSVASASTIKFSGNIKVGGSIKAK